VFLNSPHRETPKNVIKEKSKKKPVSDFLSNFLLKLFLCVFELPSLRNTRKRDKTQKIEGKLTSKFLSIFLGKVFNMDFLQKYFYGVFELPLPRNAQKVPKKKSRKKNVGWWVGGSEI
jgi:hypothetical protein